MAGFDPQALYDDQGNFIAEENPLAGAPIDPATGVPMSGLTPEQSYYQEAERAKAEAMAGGPPMTQSPMDTSLADIALRGNTMDRRAADYNAEQQRMAANDPGMFQAGPPQPAPAQEPTAPPVEQAPQQPYITPEELPEASAGVLAEQTAKDPEIAAIENQIKERVTFMESINKMQQGGIEAAQANIENISKAFSGLDADIASMRVDPRQWEKETPALTKALLLVGAGFFGYVTKGRGPNPIIQLIDNAIERDINSQVKNIDLKLKRAKLGMDKEQALAVARTTLGAAYTQRANQAFSMMMANMQDQRSIAQLQQAKQQLAQKYELDYYNAATSRMGVLGRMQAAQIKNEGSVRWDNAEAHKQVQASATGMDALEKLHKVYTEAGEGPLSRGASYIGGSLKKVVGAGSTRAKSYSELLQAEAMIAAKGALGFSISNQEGKAFSDKFPSLTDDQDTAAMKMAGIIDSSYNNLVSAYRASSPKDRERLAKDAERGTATLIRMVRKTPQIAQYLSPETKKILVGALQ